MLTSKALLKHIFGIFIHFISILYYALLCLLQRDRSKLQVFVFKVPDFNSFLIMILKKNIAKEPTLPRLLHFRRARPRLMTSVRCFWCFLSQFELLTHFGRLIMELDQTQKAWWMINLSRIEINANKASHEPLELEGEWHDFSRSSYANWSHYSNWAWISSMNTHAFTSNPTEHYG